MNSTLQLFYRDVDLLLNTIFIGGFSTIDRDSIEELAELVKSAKDLGLSYLESELQSFQISLEKQYQSHNRSDSSESIKIFGLLVEYITISQQEMSLHEVSRQIEGE